MFLSTSRQIKAAGTVLLMRTLVAGIRLSGCVSGMAKCLLKQVMLSHYIRPLTQRELGFAERKNTALTL